MLRSKSVFLPLKQKSLGITRAALWLSPAVRPRAARVNQALTGNELKALERSETRGTPFGDEPWVKKIVKKHGLESTRPRGRPGETEETAT